MPKPDINVTVGVSPASKSRPTTTGRAGIVGVSRTGKVGLLTVADRITSNNQWIDRHAGGSVEEGRAGVYQTDYDGVETYFRDRGENGLAGAELFFSRVLGPNPVLASVPIPGTSGTTLTVNFDEYGDLPNEKKVKVINGPIGGAGFRVIQLLETDGTTLIDQTAEFNDRTAVNGVKLDAGGHTPATINLSGGSGLPPTMAATAPTGAGLGTDDHANITNTQVQAALNNLGAGLGPINVAAPNWGTSPVGLLLEAHGETFRRFTCNDTLDTQTKSTVMAQAAALRAGPAPKRVELIHPWLTIPALATDGVPRAIPGSYLQLARWASTDADPENGPNQAAAGRWGLSSYALAVRATYSDDDLDDLADAGVTMIREIDGQIQVFDNLTLVNPNGPEQEFLQNNTVRYVNAKVAQFVADAAGLLFSKINRDNLAQWDVMISGHLLRDLANGDLFVDDDDPRPETAFNVDTGGSTDTGPNSAETMNAGQMNVNIGLRPVKGARMINIAISAAAMNQPVT